MKRILIVDDDAAVRISLKVMLKRAGYETVLCASPDEALEAVRAGGLSLALLDMNFSRTTDGRDGLELLRKIRILSPEMPVILMTAWASIPLAVEGVKLGAADFVSKPWDNRSLLAQIETALDLAAPPATETFDRDGIIGESPALLSVLETVRKVAPTDASVLILGENGTGKELIARALHRNSRRASRPFVEVNLGGISSSLFESEMFGHVKGAFTGAVADRRGRFAVADGGTIFLDEIGDLDAASQVKLLRVLQNHTYEPLGSSRSLTADVRVVAATNADLDAMVAAKTFREDLFYRVNLITLRLPPLRERPGDIPLLADFFAHEYARENGVRVPELSSDALEFLARLPYPGNIRELKNLIYRAAVVSGSGRLEPKDFGAVETPETGSLDDVERKAVADALSRRGGNVSAAARDLGLSRPALYRKMDKYHLR